MSFRVLPALWLCVGIVAIIYSLLILVYGPRLVEAYPGVFIAVSAPCITFVLVLRRRRSWITDAIARAKGLFAAPSERAARSCRVVLVWLFRACVATVGATVAWRLISIVPGEWWQRSLVSSVALCLAWLGLMMSAYGAFGGSSIPFVLEPRSPSKPGATEPDTTE